MSYLYGVRYQRVRSAFSWPDHLLVWFEIMRAVSLQVVEYFGYVSTVNYGSLVRDPKVGSPDQSLWKALLRRLRAYRGHRLVLLTFEEGYMYMYVYEASV